MYVCIHIIGITSIIKFYCCNAWSSDWFWASSYPVDTDIKTLIILNRFLKSACRNNLATSYCFIKS